MLLILTATPKPAEASDRQDSVKFSWALVCQQQEEASKPIDYHASVIPMHSGDRFKIYLKPITPCFIYLYLYDSQGNLYLVFPEDFEFFEQNTRPPRNYELPGVNSWFYLDENNGVELFYLIVSTQRLEKLERSTVRHLSAAGRSESSGAAAAVKHEVLDEIKRLIKESSYLSSSAEKPIAVAGHFRGIRQDTELKGISIEASEIYVQTIRLKH